MNYALAYERLIAKARARVCPEGYVERHHVLPRALGGSDDSSNLVALTSREHFIAHVLLAKMHGGIMWQALMIMKKGRNFDRYVNARIFANSRDKAAKGREEFIRQKREVDPAFDEYMKTIRGMATKNRKEGYQKAIGEKLKERMASDPAYAAQVRAHKKMAQAASASQRRATAESLSIKILELRSKGMLYKDIAKEVNRSMGFVSQVVNGKYSKSQGVADACLS